MQIASIQLYYNIMQTEIMSVELLLNVRQIACNMSTSIQHQVDKMSRKIIQVAPHTT